LVWFSFCFGFDLKTKVQGSDIKRGEFLGKNKFQLKNNLGGFGSTISSVKNNPEKSHQKKWQFIGGVESQL
jgi:hypothetical protein